MIAEPCVWTWRSHANTRNLGRYAIVNTTLIFCYPVKRISNIHFFISKLYFSKVFLRTVNRYSPVTYVDLRRDGSHSETYMHVSQIVHSAVYRTLILCCNIWSYVVSIPIKNMPADTISTYSAIDSKGFPEIHAHIVVTTVYCQLTIFNLIHMYISFLQPDILAWMVITQSMYSNLLSNPLLTMFVILIWCK